jgi:hypothetical protein
MNALQSLRADLARRFPGLGLDVQPPDRPRGTWTLRVSEPAIAVEWFPYGGFLVSADSLDEDEWIVSVEGVVEGAYDRVVMLIEGPGERMKVLDELAAEAQAMGFYDVPGEDRS